LVNIMNAWFEAARFVADSQSVVAMSWRSSCDMLGTALEIARGAVSSAETGPICACFKVAGRDINRALSWW